jgi:hypothetical protein
MSFLGFIEECAIAGIRGGYWVTLFERKGFYAKIRNRIGCKNAKLLLLWHGLFIEKKKRSSLPWAKYLVFAGCFFLKRGRSRIFCLLCRQIEPKTYKEGSFLFQIPAFCKL